MSSFLPSNTMGNFVDPTLYLTEEDGQLIYQLKDAHYNNALCINSREIAYYPLLEILSGRQYFTNGNPQSYRGVFRQTYVVPPIATGAVGTFAHNITGAQEFVQIYATVKTDVPDSRPVPYASTVAVNQQISLTIGAVNIVIVNGAASPNITGGSVVLYYTKN